MKVEKYLIVGFNPETQANPSCRLTKCRPKLDSQEISILLSISIPDDFFNKPFLSAKIDITEKPTQEISAEVVRRVEGVVNEIMGLDLRIEVGVPSI